MIVAHAPPGTPISLFRRGVRAIAQFASGRGSGDGLLVRLVVIAAIATAGKLESARSGVGAVGGFGGLADGTYDLAKNWIKLGHRCRDLDVLLGFRILAHSFKGFLAFPLRIVDDSLAVQALVDGGGHEPGDAAHRLLSRFEQMVYQLLLLVRRDRENVD
jgi:hypothetical protein